MTIHVIVSATQQFIETSDIPSKYAHYERLPENVFYLTFANFYA